MACNKKTLRATGGAHSDGTTTEVFSAFTQAMDVSEYEEVKIAIEVLASSDPTSIEVARGYEASQDQVTWDAATNVGTFTSTEGWAYGAAYASLPSGKRYLRFGIIAKKTSGGSSTDVENVRVNMIIDLKPR